MSRNEDLLRSAYRGPTDPDQLDRMNAFVRQLANPPVPRTQHRWTTPLSVAAAVAVVTAGTVLAVNGGPGNEHRNEHLGTSVAAITTVPTTRSTTVATSPATTVATPGVVVTPAPRAAVITAVPAPGAQEVSPLESVRVTVTSGRLQTVAVTDPAGRAVPGTFAANRTSWSTTGHLAYGTRYRVTGSAQGTDRRVVTIDDTFRTLTPAAQVAPVMSPSRGAAVGVGRPVSLTFPAGLDITERAAIEQRLTVTTSVPVAGAWGWVRSDDGAWRVDWRPQAFWPANTRVHVQGNLFGVRLTGRTYGKADVSTDFTIGRDQQVEVDAARRLLVVTRAGRPAGSYPVTVPSSMRSGVSTVLDAFPTMLSNRPGSAGPTASYWVLRISNSGRFIMAAPSGSVPGESVLLSSVDAKTLFGQAVPGDPVSIVNAGPALDPADDENNDWAFTWARWQQLSAR